MDVLALDKAHVWHPGVTPENFYKQSPLFIKKARGPYLLLHNGEKVLDAISSWWCKNLGHGHPALKKAIKQQLAHYEHVILANTIQEPIVQLSATLAQLAPGLEHVFYAGDGSCAIEIALKMSWHARFVTEESHRHRILVLKNSYHGETLGALSVTAIPRYRDPYQHVLFTPVVIQNIPYVNSTQEDLWENCDALWPNIVTELEPHAKHTTALIVEPILQGAGGMKLYSADFLRRLRAWCSQHNIHLIADEIMTGLGRTGKMLACEHAKIIPDFLCLSKGLTGGWLPFSAVLVHNAVYSLLANTSPAQTFWHSHTYCGNALSASVALATLRLLKEDDICARVMQLQWLLHRALEDIADQTGMLTNVRALGAMAAADFTAPPTAEFGCLVAQKALQKGVLLRPLGNTLYWLPPLNMPFHLIKQLKTSTLQALRNAHWQ